MIFSPVNLQQELIKEHMRQQRLINDVHAILQESIAEDEKILFRLRDEQRTGNNLDWLDANDSKNIFTLNEIEKVCVKYRLRFLDSSFFKAEFPYEALYAIKSFEKKYDCTIQHFKIIAPDKMFELENINKDPLLFAQLSDNRFFLLHKWGHDLKWYRAIKYFPVKNFLSLFFFLWVVASFVAFGMPASVMNVFTTEAETFLRLWLWVHCFIGFAGMCIYCAFTFDINFSSNNWDSKYYNW